MIGTSSPGGHRPRSPSAGLRASSRDEAGVCSLMIGPRSPRHKPKGTSGFRDASSPIHEETESDDDSRTSNTNEEIHCRPIVACVPPPGHARTYACTTHTHTPHTHAHPHTCPKATNDDGLFGEDVRLPHSASLTAASQSCIDLARNLQQVCFSFHLCIQS